jgi:hypothetical protein
MAKFRVLITLATLFALSACAQQPYRPSSTISETLFIGLPHGFSRQSDLSTAISAAATDASSRKGVAGSVNVENRSQGFDVPTPAPSGDPYLLALRDGQSHAEQIAKATGLPLGRITSVKELRGLPPYQSMYQSQIVLELDYGSTLTVYGTAPINSTPKFGSANSTLVVMVEGSGQNASDARASADAFESAIRSAVVPFGISPSAIRVQGGSVNAVSFSEAL